MGRAFDVTYEAEEVHVLLFCPLRNATGSLTRSAEPVVSGQSRPAKYLHQHFCCDGLTHARLSRWLRVVRASFCCVETKHFYLPVRGAGINIDL
eukprot:8119014-Pyramimonas_sp.AAC.1